MLHEDEKALDPLLRVMYSNGGETAPFFHTLVPFG